MSAIIHSAMRIAHVILSSGFAGSERSTAESCNAQCVDHEVLLIVRRGHRGRGGASIVDHLDARVEVQKVPDRWFTRRAIGHCLEAFRPDVIHTHLRRGTRLVVKLRPRAATIATLHLSVNGRHYLHVDGIVCNAEWQKRDIPPGFRGLVFKANNSLVPNRRLDAAAVATLREELGAGPGDFLIGGVGRLAWSKGWDTLIKAYIQADLPRSRCVILGEGRERRRLEKLAEGRVGLPGFRKNVKDYYQAFDLFVCPSRREPLPRVILEALDAGVPVVASTADGCRELLEIYPGDLFPIEDSAKLAELLARHQRERPGRRQVDLSAHYIENTTRAMLDAYRAVIANRKCAA